MKLDFRLDHPAPIPGATLPVRALLSITGDAPRDQERAPMNLALVLDRSGSMAGDPLDRAKEAAALLLRRIRPEDAVSVVVYDDRVETLAVGATAQGHEAAATRLNQVMQRGMTNLSGGWLRGRDLVRERLLPGGVNRIILLTDGLANQGITDPHLLTELCREAAAAGITTTTIGFGPQYDEDLLQAMAVAGGASTYYVEHADQTPGIFAEEVEGLLTLAAQNVAVEVRPGAGSELVAVRHAYPRSPVAEGVRLELGDLYAREPRQVLVEFRVRSGEPGQVVEVGQVRVVAHVVGGTGGVEHRTVDLPIRFTLSDGALVDPEVTKVALLLDAARARDEALDRHRRGDWVGAREVLSRCRSSMLSQAPDDADVLEEAEDLSLSAQHFAARQVDAADVKYMKQMARDSGWSREAAKDRIRRTRRR